MGSAKNEQRGNVLEAKVRRISLEDEEDEDTVCTPRVPKGLSPFCLLPQYPSSPSNSVFLFRPRPTLGWTSRRDTASTPCISVVAIDGGGFTSCIRVTVDSMGEEEEWIKLGDTLLRRVCNRMIPKQISPPPLFRRLACFDPTRYSS